jgi:ABC-type polysaccharide/polyol phosphate transport system ATPase subunit
VSFVVQEGEVLGVVGANGSGKSTLLRLIAGVYAPDEGLVSVRGRTTALLALGTGFRVELDAVDNVRLNGLVLGLSVSEVNSRLPDILAFADLGEAVDRPVGTYSTGMRARLAFAIAVHTNPDLLLIDEILAVGDQSFRQKCLSRVEAILNSSRAAVIVTHSESVVQRHCSKVLWLEAGRIRAMGSPHEVLPLYTGRRVTGVRA